MCGPDSVGGGGSSTNFPGSPCEDRFSGGGVVAEYQEFSGPSAFRGGSGRHFSSNWVEVRQIPSIPGHFFKHFWAAST